MITPEDIDRYLGRAGKHGERTLSLLGQYQGFISAIGTEIGKELLKDLVKEHEILLNKVADLEATDEEKMQYKVVRKMLVAWGDRITNYESKLKEIKKGE
jgi:hypothetical protein